MRRGAWILLVVSFVGCGLSVVGVEGDVAVPPPETAGAAPPLPEASLFDAIEADVVARSDAGVVSEVGF